MSDCENCEKNIKCEGCSKKVCSSCIFGVGCCPGTHIAYCVDCLNSDLELGTEMFGFICEECDKITLTCCVNSGTEELCDEICINCVISCETGVICDLADIIVNYLKLSDCWSINKNDYHKISN